VNTALASIYNQGKIEMHSLKTVTAKINDSKKIYV